MAREALKMGRIEAESRVCTPMRYAFIAIATHFAFNLLCVAAAAFAFSKISHEF